MLPLLQLEYQQSVLFRSPNGVSAKAQAVTAFFLEMSWLSFPGNLCTVTAYHLVCFFVTHQTVSLLYQFLNGTVERVLSQNTDFLKSVNGWSWPICRRSNSAQRSPILVLYPFAPGKCNTIAFRAYSLNKWPATGWRSTKLTSINVNFYIWDSCWCPYQLKLNCYGAVCFIQGQILLQFEH